jgi:hydroxymethylglutaryl-CoA lyase
MVKIIDCPRDAIQGLHTFIPTKQKIEYLNDLLKVGFDMIDFGSFVSHRAIPQLIDTGEVADNLDLSRTETGLLAIIVNERGAIDACMHDSVKYIGFPFSISETFLWKNTKLQINQAFELIKKINDNITNKGKQFVVHISMAFGNPYGDAYNYSLIEKWVSALQDIGIDIIVLSDTVGVGCMKDIKNVFNLCLNNFSDIEFGAHLHAKQSDWRTRVEAAYEGGCRRFDGALKGFGGCPMSGVDLVGNISTENIIDFMDEVGAETSINRNLLLEMIEKAARFYPHN